MFKNKLNLETYNENNDPYDVVRGLRLEKSEDTYLFHDIFAINGSVICICPVNPSKYINRGDISIFVNESKLPILFHKEYYEYEPIDIIAFDSIDFIDEQEIQVRVEYADLTTIHYTDTITLQNMLDEKSKDLAIPSITIDYKLVKPWVRYYKEMGVDDFYIYLNKPIPYNDYINIIKERSRETGIKMIEWPYRYEFRTPSRMSKKGYFFHNSQMTTMHQFMYKYGGKYKYGIFIDVDEYLVHPDLKQLIQSEKTAYIFRNIWAETKDGVDPIEDLPSEFKVDSEDHGYKRTKCITKLDDVNAHGVHFPKIKNWKDYVLSVDEGWMAHFANFGKKERRVTI